MVQKRIAKITVVSNVSQRLHLYSIGWTYRLPHPKCISLVEQLLLCWPDLTESCFDRNTEKQCSNSDSLDRLLPAVSTSRRKSSTLGKTEPPLLRTGTRTIYTVGRPPWYNEHGAQFKEAFVIGTSRWKHTEFILNHSNKILYILAQFVPLLGFIVDLSWNSKPEWLNEVIMLLQVCVVAVPLEKLR